MYVGEKVTSKRFSDDSSGTTYLCTKAMATRWSGKRTGLLVSMRGSNLREVLAGVSEVTESVSYTRYPRASNKLKIGRQWGILLEGSLVVQEEDNVVFVRDSTRA